MFCFQRITCLSAWFKNSLTSQSKRLFALVLFGVSLAGFASETHYSLIVDAGSSGSRAHVFAYTQVSPESPLPQITEVFSKSTKPGLSAYAPAGMGAGASLKPILDAALVDLNNQGIDPSQVSVQILATAGMRLLPIDQQKAIYKDVSSYVHANYPFQIADQNIRTISGNMEGVYAWLDINYLQQNFQNGSNTVGSIDMGGASTQIAFATSDTSKPTNEVDLVINHKNYRVFSQSFLGLGMNQSTQAMTTSPSASSCYPLDYEIKEALMGHFDFAACSAIYASLIDSFKPAEQLIPSEGQHFVAFSGIYSVYSFFNLVKTTEQGSLESQINQVCYSSWSSLLTKYPGTPATYLSTECANAVYFDTLLYKTYQLQGSQLEVSDNINGKTIDWTLGALLFSLVQ